MRYEARVTVYDMFEQVCVSARIWESSPYIDEQPGEVHEVVGYLRGEGEEDPHAWLQDALVGLIELL